MIKARSGTSLIFGLSEENIKLLKEGKPIHIDLREIGIANGNITIFYGPTEDIMETQMYSMIFSKEQPKI